jgi:predicted transcriptional regulator
MYDVYIMHRTQIYLDDEQDRALAARARRAGRTKSALIRDAIEGYLTPPSDEQTGLARLRAAIAEASGAAPSLPTGEQYVEDVRAADLARERDLDARRG